MSDEVKIPGLGNMNDLVGMDFGNALKELTGGPNKKYDRAGIINFLFRGRIPDDRRAQALPDFLAHCLFIEDIDHISHALMKVATWSAIDADRINILLQAIVGQLMGQKAAGKKRRPWDKNNETPVEAATN